VGLVDTTRTIEGLYKKRLSLDVRATGRALLENRSPQKIVNPYGTERGTIHFPNGKRKRQLLRKKREESLTSQSEKGRGGQIIKEKPKALPHH